MYRGRTAPIVGRIDFAMMSCLESYPQSYAQPVDKPVDNFLLSK